MDGGSSVGATACLARNLVNQTRLKSWRLYIPICRRYRVACQAAVAMVGAGSHACPPHGRHTPNVGREPVPEINRRPLCHDRVGFNFWLRAGMRARPCIPTPHVTAIPESETDHRPVSPMSVRGRRCSTWPPGRSRSRTARMGGIDSVVGAGSHACPPHDYQARNAGNRMGTRTRDRPPRWGVVGWTSGYGRGMPSPLRMHHPTHPPLAVMETQPYNIPFSNSSTLAASTSTPSASCLMEPNSRPRLLPTLSVESPSNEAA